MVPKGNSGHGTKVLVGYRFLLGRNQRDFLVTGLPTQPSRVMFCSINGNMPENKTHQACAGTGLPSCVLTFVYSGTCTIVVRPVETCRYASTSGIRRKCARRHIGSGTTECEGNKGPAAMEHPTTARHKTNRSAKTRDGGRLRGYTTWIQST